MINSFQSGPDEWTHWVRVPDHRRNEFYDWISVSIPDVIPNEQHSEPYNGVKHIVYRITVKNSAHNTLLMLTWG
jgi:hypothetical protein